MSWTIIIIAIIMLYLLNKVFDLKNLLNPFVFFYLYQTAFCFIALSYSDTWYPRIPISEDLKFFIILAYILTFVGAILSRYLFSRTGISYVKINDLSLENKPTRSFQISGLIIFMIGIVFFLLFTYKTDGIIIFADDIENERIARKSGAGLYNLIFLSFMLYGYIIILFMKDKTQVVKGALFLLTCFAFISYGSRQPLLKLIVACFIMLTILSRKKISIKKYIKIGVILFAILVIVGAIRSNFQDENVSFFTLLRFRAGWRPFVNIQNLQRIYDFFPEKHGFLYGQSYLIDLKLFLPGSHPNFGTYLKGLMNWDFDGGSVTPSFIGIGYLNFGKLAFILYPLLYGFILNSIYQLIIYKNKVKPLHLVFLLLFSIGVSGSVSTSIFNNLINNILFLVIVLITHLLIKQIIIKNPFNLKT